MEIISPKYCSEMELPFPVLFNTWKHHAAALRHRIGEFVCGGEAALQSLADELIVIGAKLMDLYTGAYSPAEIGRLVLEQLGRDGCLDLEPFRNWVQTEGGYRILTLPDDSAWVLRLGDEDDRYVHVHPGRWVPHTRRVRANVLKTAVMVLAVASVRSGDPMERTLVNRVRQEYLGLAPFGRDLDGEQGLGEVIDLLRS
ncbi:MAG: hypothetical protein HYS12_27815 [Planctomycetes bacterium]|nr:hypothetical protein [Planctomycetota bacterium]